RTKPEDRSQRPEARNQHIADLSSVLWLLASLLCKRERPAPATKQGRALGCFEWMSALSGSIARSAAAAAAVTTTAAAAAAATPAVAAPLFTRPGLVHGQRPPLEHGAVQRSDRCVRPVAHLHETEAP